MLVEPGLIHAASAFQAALSTKSVHQLADVHLMYCFSPGRDGSLLEVLGQSWVDSTDLTRESHTLPHDTSTCIAG